MTKTHKIMLGGATAVLAGALLLDLGVYYTGWALVVMGALTAALAGIIADL